jgi:hypothetical protein
VMPEPSACASVKAHIAQRCDAGAKRLRFGEGSYRAAM